jgi:hypothetical protein
MRKLLCLLTLLVFAAPLFAADPYAGTWTLNTAKTKYTTNTPAKNLTLVIEEQGPNLQVTATGTNSDGSPISVKFTIPVSGGAGTVQEGDFNGITSKRVSANVRDNSYTKDGKEIRSRHIVISKDGKTMTSKVKGTNPNGNPVDGTDVYDKQ